MRILVYLMNFGVDSRWGDIFLLALYRDRIFISITLLLSEVSTHQPARLFPKPLARTFTPFFFLEQSRTELLPSALPKLLPAPCRPSRAPCPLPALAFLPAHLQEPPGLPCLHLSSTTGRHGHRLAQHAETPPELAPTFLSPLRVFTTLHSISPSCQSTARPPTSPEQSPPPPPKPPARRAPFPGPPPPKPSP